MSLDFDEYHLESVFKKISKSKDPDGYIYVIRSITSGLIKIGFTTNLLLRISQHRTTHFRENLIVEAYYKAKFSQEKRFHRLHKQYAIGNTEWYDPHPEIEFYVEQAKKFNKLEGGDKLKLLHSPETSVKEFKEMIKELTID